MSMITEQVEELREEADFIIETLDMQYPTTIGVAKIMKRAADTIEQLAAKVREDQKAFEDIMAEIDEKVLENLSDGGDDWFTAEKVNECLAIIDKHNPSKAGKERND